MLTVLPSLIPDGTLNNFLLLLSLPGCWSHIGMLTESSNFAWLKTTSNLLLPYYYTLLLLLDKLGKSSYKIKFKKKQLKRPFRCVHVIEQSSDRWLSGDSIFGPHHSTLWSLSHYATTPVIVVAYFKSLIKNISLIIRLTTHGFIFVYVNSKINSIISKWKPFNLFMLQSHYCGRIRRAPGECWDSRSPIGGGKPNVLGQLGKRNCVLWKGVHVSCQHVAPVADGPEGQSSLCWLRYVLEKKGWL